MPRTELQELMSKLDIETSMRNFKVNAKVNEQHESRIEGRFMKDENDNFILKDGKKVWVPSKWNFREHKFVNDHSKPNNADDTDYILATDEDIQASNERIAEKRIERRKMNEKHFNREKVYIPHSSPKIKDWDGSHIPEFRHVLRKSNGEVDWNAMQAHPDQLVLICRHLIAKATHNKKKYKGLLSLLLTHGMHHQTGHHTHHGPHHHNRNQNRGPRPPRPYRASAPNTAPAAAGSQP
jgi:hypothetical protein